MALKAKIRQHSSFNHNFNIDDHFLTSPILDSVVKYMFPNIPQDDCYTILHINSETWKWHKHKK